MAQFSIGPDFKPDIQFKDPILEDHYDVRDRQMRRIVDSVIGRMTLAKWSDSLKADRTDRLERELDKAPIVSTRVVGTNSLEYLFRSTFPCIY